MLDCYTQLFNDVQDYFGKDLMMFDGYYLTHEKQINNLCKKLITKSATYAKLLKSFDQHYEGWIDFVKAKTETEPKEIVSISHELIERNEKTGLCLYNCSTCLGEEYKFPSDCEFFSLENVVDVEFEPCEQPLFLFRYGTKNIKPKSYTHLCKDFNFSRKKQKGIARTIIMYWALVSKRHNTYIYFIRPRVGHGIYNGSLVLLLRRPLSELEFNSLSSFLNEILCETAIAKFIHTEKVKQGKKIIDTVAEKDFQFTWGGKPSNRHPSPETERLKNTLKIGLISLMKDPSMLKKINSKSLEWCSKFCKFLFSSTENIETFKVPFDLHPFNCDAFSGLTIENELNFKAALTNLAIGRKITYLLSRIIQDEISVAIRSDEIKERLPALLLYCFQYNELKDGFSENALKQWLTTFGFSKMPKKGNWIKIQTSSPYISNQELIWINDITPSIIEKIMNGNFTL